MTLVHNHHTIEPKITTLSYIQPELWQFKAFPIDFACRPYITTLTLLCERGIEYC